MARSVENTGRHQNSPVAEGLYAELSEVVVQVLELHLSPLLRRKLSENGMGIPFFSILQGVKLLYEFNQYR